LADSVRRDKYNHPFSATLDPGANADITLKYVEGKKKGGRAKSPLGHNTLGQNSSTQFLDNRSSADTLKMYDQKETAPAWYKSLKKNLK